MKFSGYLSAITATVFIFVCSCTEELEPNIEVAFSANKTSILVGEEIVFNDSSLGSPSKWEWEFEGGTPSVSNEQNPDVIYNSSGIYNVILKASNNDHSDVLLKEEYITIYDLLVAQFDLNDSIVDEGSTINFTDLSVGLVSNREWSFEGGSPSTSTDQNPNVIYTTPGIYQVILKISNELEPNGKLISREVIVLPTAGLIAYFPFDGNAMDQSGNDLNGILVGGASLTSDKRNNSNQAIHFDGIDDRIEVAHNSLLEPQKYTISAWIKAENESGVIVSLTDFSPIYNNCGYIMSIKFGNIRGFSNISSGSWAKNIDDEIISLNEWHHILFTYNGQTLKLYFEGVEVSSVDIPHIVNYSEQNPLQIGSYSSELGPSAFTGDIDEVRIYNRALNVNEIKALSRE